MVLDISELMKTDTWTDNINTITSEVLNLTDKLSASELNWKPDGDTWSIAQILDHIIRFNESYYPALEALQKGDFNTPWFSRFGIITSSIGKMLLNFSSPERKRKMSTFNIWKPEDEIYSPDIIKRFEAHQSELAGRIDASESLLDKDVVISSPASRFIVYKLETAFDLIVSHEQRHQNQAIEVVNLLHSRD